MTDILRDLYREGLTTPSDTWQHLQTLHELASGCDHVTEMGTCHGWSTRAFLYAQPSVLICYDLVRQPEVDMLEAAAMAAGRPRFVFHQADVRQVEIEETDLLFIDTRHDYEQMERELALHGNKARRYLVFHDTMGFREIGETPGHRGIWPAIEEFIWANPQWLQSLRPTSNQDLTILSREGLF